MDITLLNAAWIAARDLAIKQPTTENRNAAKAAWQALEDASPKRKTSGYASRAGKQQAAARRALETRKR